MDSDRLKAENTNLVAAYRDKQRKHQQTQELYDRLKRKEMTAATQSAAFESVDEVLGNVQHRSGHSPSSYMQHYAPVDARLAQRDPQPSRVDHNGIEQVHRHQRSGSNNSGGGGGMMLPPPAPPIRRTGAFSNTYTQCELLLRQLPNMILMCDQRTKCLRLQITVPSWDP